MCRMWATHWRKPSLWSFRFLHLHIMAKNKKAKQELISHSDYVLIFWSSGKHLLQFGLIIGHFRVPKTLTFKMRPSVQPFWKLKMSFICMKMKNHLHIKGWALNLVLIQRLGGTRKWLIQFDLREGVSQGVFWFILLSDQIPECSGRT